MRQPLLLLAIYLFIQPQLWAQTPVLIKDINPGSASGINGYISAIVNNIAYFWGTDGIHGMELWRSDGTEAGTYMIKDINPGKADSFFHFYPFSRIGNVFYFAANDGVHGIELWRSDGTEAGTYLVKDINPTSIGMGYYLFNNSFVINGILYFGADDGVHGMELWRSDGTQAGTFLVKDINPGSVDGYYNTDFTDSVINGVLYFAGYDGTHGIELWRSDGSEAGTYMVKDINPNPEKDGYTIYGTNSVVNGVLYFGGDDGTHGVELWRSDGTPAGTYMVKDINPDPNLYGYVGFNSTINGILYFRGNDGNHGLELWRSDGTEVGTYLVKDVNPGSSSGYFGNSYYPVIDGVLYFGGYDVVHGAELWRSDGTEAGTYLVKDIYPGYDSGYIYWAGNHYVQDGIRYFIANDGVHGGELWRSDGTEAGTYIVKDINPGPDNGYKTAGFNYPITNGTIYFAADDGEHGIELWKLGDSNKPLCSSLQSGDWTSSSTWSCGHEPTIDDIVLINPGHTVTVSTMTAQAMQLNYNGGRIQFAPGVRQVFVKGGGG